MSKMIVGLIFAASLGVVAQGAAAGSAGVSGGGRYVAGGGRYVAGGGGAYVTGGHSHPVYGGVRHGWHGGYWGPTVGIYYGGLGYWGGWPYGWGYGYGYPYPYAYAPVVVNTTTVPQSYIEQEAVPPVQAAPSANYWYYCTQPAGYFPHVQSCSHAWMKVIPQAPGDTTSAPRLAPP